MRVDFVLCKYNVSDSETRLRMYRNTLEAARVTLPTLISYSVEETCSPLAFIFYKNIIYCLVYGYLY